MPVEEYNDEEKGDALRDDTEDTENDASVRRKRVARRSYGNGPSPRILLYVIGGLVLVGAGYVLGSNPALVRLPTEIEKGSNGTQAASPVVATIDGLEIRQAELDARIQTIIEDAKARGLPEPTQTDLDALRGQVLSARINEVLLAAAAQKAEVQVTPEEVNRELDALIQQAGGQEKFDANLVVNGVSRDIVAGNIAVQILIRKYANQLVGDIKATEEEVKAFYAGLRAQNSELPPLEEVREQVGRDLLNQKFDEALAPHLAALREKADIKYPTAQ